MPTTFDQPGQDTIDLIESVMRQYHPALAKAGVTVQTLFAINPDGDAVKLHGYPCAAKIRVNPLKERAKGQGDAELIVCDTTWGHLSKERRIALIDHELTHLELVLDDNGMPKRDDLGRPKLRMRLHDAQVGIFKQVIERHRRNALDAEIAEQFIGEYGQLLMWAKDASTVG